MPYLTTNELVFSEKTSQFSRHHSKATDFGGTLYSQHLTDVTGCVDQVRFGQPPSLYVQFHASITILAVIWSAMTITTFAFSKQLPSTIEFRTLSQGSFPTLAIDARTEVVVLWGNWGLYFAYCALFLFIDLKHKFRKIFLRFLLMHTSCMLRSIILRQTKPAESAIKLDFGAFRYMVLHIPRFYLLLAMLTRNFYLRNHFTCNFGGVVEYFFASATWTIPVLFNCLVHTLEAQDFRAT